MADSNKSGKKIQKTQQKSSSGNQEITRTVAFRGGGFEVRSFGTIAPFVFIAIIAFWEFGTQTGFISSLVLPAPSEVFIAFRELVESGMLLVHLSASLKRLIIGWTCGSILGVGLGLMIGLSPLARAGFVPLVSAIFPIPKMSKPR